MDKSFLVERDILIYALRYSLGRRTFAPTTVIENIKHNINKFRKTDLELIIRDIEEQKNFGGYGDKCDIDNWLNFKQYIGQQLDILESD